MLDFIIKAIGWCVLVGTLATVYAVYSGALVVPERFNPWAPLQVAAEPNSLTPFKLQRATADDALCQTALATSGLRYQPVPNRETGPGCGFNNAVRITALVSASGRTVTMAPFVLSCRTALSLVMWEQHVVQPAAQLHLGQPVTRLDHLGSYACRNLYHRDNASRSQHATADALDVAGLRMAGGGQVSVLRDWPRETPEARFLQEIHAGACRFFDGVLGPAYNTAHRDHFHLDRGRFRICR
ncbi:MAG: extensin family protein [Burkholderiales bacterium]|nr:MAG: extensin family protein [Burkholderiales bacterium]